MDTKMHMIVTVCDNLFSIASVSQY